MKTKMTLLALFLISFQLPTNAQSLLVDGATWHYNLYTFWEPGVDYNQFYIDGDTLIDDKTCKILRRLHRSCDFRPETDYLYEDGDQVYYYNREQEAFKLLYDYGAQEGDILELELWEGMEGFWGPKVYIRIDFVDHILLDTATLRRFFVRYDVWDDGVIEFSANADPTTIVEGIGSLTNYFHFFDNGYCDWRYTWGLRCFTHPTYGRIKFEDIVCDSVIIFSKNEEQLWSSTDLEVSPNPFTEKLDIQFSRNLNDASITIYNVMGQEVIFRKSVDFFADERQTIEVSDLKQGTYIVVVREQDGQLVASLKVVKY